jgi:hypothetical protein
MVFYAVNVLMLTPLVLLALVAKSHKGLPVDPADWWFGAFSGVLTAAFVHALLYGETRTGRYMGVMDAWPESLVFGSALQPRFVKRDQILGISLTPEPSVPECFRLTVTYPRRGRAGRKGQVWQWFMLVDDLAALRTFELASGLHIQGWKELGILAGGAPALQKPIVQKDAL